MGYKITLIEYNEGIYSGDDSSPELEFRDYYESALGGDQAEAITDQTEADRIDDKITVQLNDLHDYLIGISSSSSSSSSFSSESSSSSSESSSSESSSSESSSSESSSSSSSSQSSSSSSSQSSSSSSSSQSSNSSSSRSSSSSSSSFSSSSESSSSSSSSLSPTEDTFGITNQGGSSASYTDDIRGCNGSPDHDGQATKITVYLEGWGVGEKVKCALYDASDNSLVAVTDEDDTGGTTGWHDFIFSSPVNVYSAKNYLIAVVSDSNMAFYYTTAAGQEYPNQNNIGYPSMPDPVSSSTGYQFSIYCTYEY